MVRLLTFHLLFVKSGAHVLLHHFFEKVILKILSLIHGMVMLIRFHFRSLERPWLMSIVNKWLIIECLAVRYGTDPMLAISHFTKPLLRFL
jgi:hypothetical protein